jgi:hypothetical protein
MPKKIQKCVMEDLIGVPLPNHAASYTTISHKFIIDYSKQQLLAAGFIIVDEEYRSTADGQIAQGIYKLNYNSDPELSMMFAWTNSYNKQVKFKCLVGAYINKTGTVMVSGDISTWTRKHTGTADVETQQTIDSQIANAHMYYNQLVHDKSTMENVSLNKRRQSQMLGILFAEYQILTTEQASLIRQQMDKPSNFYANTDSLWAFYCYVTIALQSSHPKTWMEDQRILHYFISTVGNFTPVPVAPVEEVVVDELENNYGQPENQTNLLVQIAEITGDESLLAAQYPVTEEEAFQLSDNQVVQEEVEIEPVLHQSEEIILEANEAEEDHVIIEDEIWTTEEEPLKIATIVNTNEAEETPFDLDAEDDAMLDALLVPIEREISPENSTSIFPQDETVVYTDPVGNTFEAPIVINEFAIEDNFDLTFAEETNEDGDDIPDFF